MDNMGGLRKLWYIDADDFVSLVPGENDLSVLTLENGAKITEIEFSEDTGQISESGEIDDSGLIYNFEASCRIPKCGPDNINLFGDLRLKKLLIIGEDNNGNFWLTGSPGTYFNIIIKSDTGTLAADPNAIQLKLAAGLPEESVFIESPFN
jgi:hypothetical protein